MGITGATFTWATPSCFPALLDFSYAVSRKPRLKEKYGAKAMQYVERAKRDLFEKWDSRGTWKDMGAFGVYVSWDKYGLPGQYKDWQPRTPVPAGTGQTLPFNKQEDVGECALRIWQITGDAKYKRRAEQIFGFAKSRIQNFKGCYHWNYWEPGGQWDISGALQDPFCLWINTHGERPYQAGEAAKILKAYNAGITNLKVMWNGDLQHRSWANSNADIFHKMGQPVPAGCVWSALAQLDSTEYKLTADWVAGLVPNRGRNDFIRSYFNQVTAKTTPRFQRLDVSGEVEIPAAYAQFPMGDVRTVTFAAVLPPAFSVGEKAVIACKLSEPGDLEVALYSADGQTRLATLLHRREKAGPTGHEGVVAVAFADAGSPGAAKLSPGEYRVRWTVAGDGYREFPFTLRPAKP
jgi:hypothetical protein